MMLCAAIGGPFATIAYVIALNSATAAGNPGVIVPIAALNCAIGAILGRILFRQDLKTHKVAGIVICLFSAALIGGTSFAMGPEALMGCLFAFLAAFGWGFEGCVAGFGTILIDYRIGIAIRQMTAGILELFVVFPVLAAIGGGLGSAFELAGAAFASPALVFFVISGFFAMPAFSFWYKGNSMCGTALGMACILGALLHLDHHGSAQHRRNVCRLPPSFGRSMDRGAHDGRRHLLHSRQPREIFQRQQERRVIDMGDSLIPLHYAKHFMDGEADCADGVVRALEGDYRGYKLLNRADVEETLATAKENGLLDEAGYDLSEEGYLRIRYRINSFGEDMMGRYIAK